MDLDHLLATADGLLTVASTVDRPDELHRALDLVIDFVGAGFTVERFASGGKPSALLYRAVTRPPFRVVLNAHLDVVPAPPAQFRPRRAGDRLYARGAHDMKVSALVQADVFRRLATTLPYPLGLQLVTDEEVGGRDGTLHQLRQGVTAGFVVIGEQSGLRIVTESKGILGVRLSATGRAAHGAYPWTGDNALLRVTRAVNALLDRYPVPAEEAWRTTVNLARIDTANRATNQVPADATAWLDIRYPPQDDDFTGRSGAQIADHLGLLCGPGVTVTVDTVDPPHHADPGRREVRLLQRAAREQGYPADLLRKHGAADGRFYHAYGIDAVIFGIGGAGQHGPDEYADLATVGPYHRALTRFLLDLGAAGGPDPGGTR